MFDKLILACGADTPDTYKGLKDLANHTVTVKDVPTNNTSSENVAKVRNMVNTVNTLFNTQVLMPTTEGPDYKQFMKFNIKVSTDGTEDPFTVSNFRVKAKSCEYFEIDGAKNLILGTDSSFIFGSLKEQTNLDAIKCVTKKFSETPASTVVWTFSSKREVGNTEAGEWVKVQDIVSKLKNQSNDVDCTIYLSTSTAILRCVLKTKKEIEAYHYI